MNSKNGKEKSLSGRTTRKQAVSDEMVHKRNRRARRTEQRRKLGEWFRGQATNARYNLGRTTGATGQARISSATQGLVKGPGRTAARFLFVWNGTAACLAAAGSKGECVFIGEISSLMNQ